MNERAAKFFEAWADKNLRAMGAVGGYQAQESIGYVGPFYFSKYDNGARGWYKGQRKETVGYEGQPALIETKDGFATSYVYYPCAD